MKYLGVRKCKKLIKDLFYPDICFYDRSYNAFAGLERLAGYFGDFGYSISIQNRINGELWIHIVVFDKDDEISSANVYVLDPTHTHFTYQSERSRKELQAL